MTSDPCKVGRVAERWDLDDVDRDLADRRTRDRASLRDLAAYFDRRVLRAAMERAGMAPLDGEPANVHRLLTDDDVSGAARTRARRRLERAGVDVDAVRSDFVSHPTVGKHLRECLDVSKPADGDPVSTARERVARMQSRSEAVVHNAVEGLADGGEVDGGDLTVVVDARVVCETCSAHHSVESFLDRGGCDCE